MLKRFLRAVSDVLWAVGAEELAMRLLLKTYESDDEDILNTRRWIEREIGYPQHGYRIDVVFEDEELLGQLSPQTTNVVCLPTCIEDINL